MDRIQRLGDKDNFWQMGDTGPCGPCSEIHIDRGPEFGPDGGPLGDPAGDRFMEFWNLVFMQYNQSPDGTRTPLPKPSVDTGAGLERILALLQGVDSVWETDLMAPADRDGPVGHRQDRRSSATTTTVTASRCACSPSTPGRRPCSSSDGVFPSNEGRGYVLRRIIRRAVRYAFLLGTEQLVMPRLVETAIDVMGNAYPDVVKNRDFLVGVLTREEERFRHTLKTGLTILDDELVGGAKSERFHGVPAPRHVRLPARAHPGDRRRTRASTSTSPGSRSEMTRAARAAPSAARKDASADDGRLEGYREVVEQFGVTEFVGDADDETQSRILAVLPVGTDDDGHELVEIFLDRTPFYAESGGQVGDTGTITTETGSARVLDTTFALPNLRRHTARIVDGSILGRAGRGRHHRRRPSQRDPPQSHRHTSAALGAASGARRTRQAGRLTRR